MILLAKKYYYEQYDEPFEFIRLVLWQNQYLLTPWC